MLTADGHILLYEREVPCELRMQEGTKAPQDVGRLEPIRVKVLILVSSLGSHKALRFQCLGVFPDDFHILFVVPSQGEEAHPREVRIEASSENDLFFHYTHVYARTKHCTQGHMVQRRRPTLSDFSH